MTIRSHSTLITGATSGIGRTIAQRLLNLGINVIGLGRDHTKFTPDNKHYHSYQIDFTDLNATEALGKSLAQKHSDIDTIICCAGIGYFGYLEQLSLTQIHTLFQVNVISQIVLLKTLLPLLKRKQYGRIILIGSEAALSGEREGSIYCASKFALRGFSQSLRKESRSSGIGISLINPGMVNTPFFDHLTFSPSEPHINAIQPEEIADTIELLLKLSPTCIIEEINLQPKHKSIHKKLTRVE